MKHLATLALCLFTASGVAQDPPKPADLVVHEWGVMIGASGDALFAMDAASTPIDDLPDFVQKFPSRPLPLPRATFARKPVLYFYAASDMSVDVRVDVPSGYPFAWWPKADESAFEAKPTKPQVPPHSFSRNQNMGGHLAWKNVKLSAKPARELQKVDAKHWIAAARVPEAAYVDVGGASERFLFYEALTLYDGAPMIRADGDDHVLVGGPLQDVKNAILIQVNDGKLALASVEDLPKNLGKDEVELNYGGLPTKLRRLALKAGDAKAVDAVAKLLKDAGLSESESATVAGVWKDDFLKREGTRLLYVMPEAKFNALLPLKITPAPKELRRVMLMSVEAVSSKQLEAVTKLKDDVGKSNDAQARAKLAAYGRPVLQELMFNRQNYDPKGQMNLGTLYEQLEASAR